MCAGAGLGDGQIEAHRRGRPDAAHVTVIAGEADARELTRLGIGHSSTAQEAQLGRLEDRLASVDRIELAACVLNVEPDRRAATVNDLRNFGIGLADCRPAQANHFAVG